MIQSKIHDDVVTITLDRAEKANSLTKQMLRELIELVEVHKSAKAIIFTGNGKVFSAGADLDEARAGLAISELWEQLSHAIANLKCLTIAALNGTLAGGAFGMVLACDLRICVDRSKFFYPVINLGFLPQPSDPIRMVQLIGPARTKMILLGGQKISAQTAYDYGLVDEIVGDDKLLIARAVELAQGCVNASLGHGAAIKQMIPVR